MGKKKLPSFASDAINLDFFDDTTNNVLLNSVSQTADEIEKTQTSSKSSEQSKLVDKDIENTEEKDKRENDHDKQVPQGIQKQEWKTTKVKRKKEQDPENVDAFIEFIANTRSRKDTQPVRITRKNYMRINNLKETLGGSLSIPEIINHILDMYLNMVEKKLEESL